MQKIDHPWTRTRREESSWQPGLYCAEQSENIFRGVTFLHQTKSAVQPRTAEAADGHNKIGRWSAMDRLQQSLLVAQDRFGVEAPFGERPHRIALGLDRESPRDSRLLSIWRPGGPLEIDHWRLSDG
jgi:hypothetical protein